MKVRIDKFEIPETSDQTAPWADQQLETQTTSQKSSQSEKPDGAKSTASSYK